MDPEYDIGNSVAIVLSACELDDAWTFYNRLFRTPPIHESRHALVFAIGDDRIRIDDTGAGEDAELIVEVPDRGDVAMVRLLMAQPPGPIADLPVTVPPAVCTDAFRGPDGLQWRLDVTEVTGPGT